MEQQQLTIDKRDGAVVATIHLARIDSKTAEELRQSLSSAAASARDLPLIVVLPVIGLLVNMIFGGRILNSGPAGEKIVGAIASTAVGLAFVVSVLQFVSLLGHHEGQVVPVADWITIGDLHIRSGWQLYVRQLLSMHSDRSLSKSKSLHSAGWQFNDRSTRQFLMPAQM